MGLFNLFNKEKKNKEDIKKVYKSKKSVITEKNQNKNKVLKELKKLSKTKLIKSKIKLTNSERLSLIKKVHYDYIEKFNFKKISSKIENEQKVEIFETPNKYFRIVIIEKRSFYIRCNQINNFSFYDEKKSYMNRLQENSFKNGVISKLEDSFSKWNLDILDEYNQKILKSFFSYKQTIEDEKENFSKSKEKDLKLIKSTFFEEFDKNGDGIIDIIESDDLMKLFRKHQSVIKEFNKDYINHIVKISNYLKTKGSNIQKIFSQLKKIKNKHNLNKNIGLLKNQIHTYEVVLFHSLNMITSIVEDDLITVNEIYEEFDKLKMFKTDHEKEVSQKLSDIGDGLSTLMYSINSMERNIVSGLNTLSYVTQDGFSDLNNSLSRELQSIDSSIQSNNLLNTIQTYQLYKINKQTKGLIN